MSPNVARSLSGSEPASCTPQFTRDLGCSTSERANEAFCHPPHPRLCALHDRFNGWREITRSCSDDSRTVRPPDVESCGGGREEADARGRLIRRSPQRFARNGGQMERALIIPTSSSKIIAALARRYTSIAGPNPWPVLTPLSPDFLSPSIFVCLRHYIHDDHELHILPSE
jgi:hypothetical protein